MLAASIPFPSDAQRRRAVRCNLNRPGSQARFTLPVISLFRGETRGKFPVQRAGNSLFPWAAIPQPADCKSDRPMTSRRISARGATGPAQEFPASREFGMGPCRCAAACRAPLSAILERPAPGGSAPKSGGDALEPVEDARSVLDGQYQTAPSASDADFSERRATTAPDRTVQTFYPACHTTYRRLSVGKRVSNPFGLTGLKDFP